MAASCLRCREAVKAAREHLESNRVGGRRWDDSSKSDEAAVLSKLRAGPVCSRNVSKSRSCHPKHNSGGKKSNKHKQLRGIVPEMGGGQIVYVFPFFSGEMWKKDKNPRKSQEKAGTVPG